VRSVLNRSIHALSALVLHRADWRAMGWSGVAGAVLSAALLTLAFPKFDLFWLAWVALVPIFIATRNRSPRAAKWLWYLFGVLWIYGSVWWFSVTAYVNPLVIPGVVLMALILGLYVLLFGWGAVWLRRLGSVSLALIPMWWVVAVEFLRTATELAFPWLYLAHTQHAQLALIQSATVFGTHALSFLIVAGSLLLAEIVALLRPPSAPKSWVPVITALVVWCVLMSLNAVLGAQALLRWAPPQSDQRISVAVVQPNWEQRDKILATDDDAMADALFAQLLDQLAEVEPDSVDLVILPEAVVPEFEFPLEGKGRLQSLAAAAGQLNATVVFGAGRLEISPDLPPGQQPTLADVRFYNSIYALQPSAARSESPPFAVYDKIRLVPFSESAPLISLIPGLMQLTLGQIALFTAGVEPNQLPVHGGALLGAHVCFESTFPGLVRQFAAGGAQILATLTNDGWFLDSAGAPQHWIVQPFRAVENRRPIIQAANTGISSVVHPTGAVIARSQVGERTTLRARVEPLHATTVYTRHGDWAAQLFAALSLFGIAAAMRRRPLQERTD